MENKNNKVELQGTVSGKYEFSHEIFGEGFYTNALTVTRTSGMTDEVPFMVSDRMIDITNNKPMNLKISGQFRSYNKHDTVKNKLILSVFVGEIEEIEEANGDNNIELYCYVCKKPVYRKTPLGREITDLLVAVNRPYGKSDYIPCVAWGKSARYASDFELGQRIKILGRIQSREYIKKIDEENSETRTAYEVSVKSIEKLN